MINEQAEKTAPAVGREDLEDEVEDAPARRPEKTHPYDFSILRNLRKAQGFTIAMESGASVVRSIERVLLRSDDDSVAPLSTALRDELLQRNVRRERRLVQLLRSTELVQRMAQPSGLGSILSTWIVRPVIKMCPEVVKMRVFDYVIRYSLGLTG